LKGPMSYPFRIVLTTESPVEIKIHEEVLGQVISKISSVKVEQDGTIIIDAWTTEGAGQDEIPLEVSEGRTRSSS
jgi:hypothetical protein